MTTIEVDPAPLPPEPHIYRVPVKFQRQASLDAPAHVEIQFVTVSKHLLVPADTALLFRSASGAEYPAWRMERAAELDNNHEDVLAVAVPFEVDDITVEGEVSWGGPAIPHNIPAMWESSFSECGQTRHGVETTTTSGELFPQTQRVAGRTLPRQTPELLAGCEIAAVWRIPYSDGGVHVDAIVFLLAGYTSIPVVWGVSYRESDGQTDFTLPVSDGVRFAIHDPSETVTARLELLDIEDHWHDAATPTPHELIWMSQTGTIGHAEVHRIHSVIHLEPVDQTEEPGEPATNTSVLDDNPLLVLYQDITRHRMPYGIALNWGEPGAPWLAYGNIPPDHRGGPVGGPGNNRFATRRGEGNLYTAAPGAQSQFGIWSAQVLRRQDVAALDNLRLAAEGLLLLRAMTEREADGSMVFAGNHPNLHTHRTTPHRNGSDALGKAHPYPANGVTGRNRRDKQHYEQGPAQAWVALTGGLDYHCQRAFRQQMQLLLADSQTLNGWGQYGRAHGRTLRTVSDAMLLVPQNERLGIEAFGWANFYLLTQTWLGKDTYLDPAKRVNITRRHPPGENWAPYEEALCAVGCYGLARNLSDLSQRTQAAVVAYMLAASVVTAMPPLGNGGYYLPYRVAYNAGTEVPVAELAPPTVDYMLMGGEMACSVLVNLFPTMTHLLASIGRDDRDLFDRATEYLTWRKGIGYSREFDAHHAAV